MVVNRSLKAPKLLRSNFPQGATNLTMVYSGVKSSQAQSILRQVCHKLTQFYLQGSCILITTFPSSVTRGRPSFIMANLTTFDRNRSNMTFISTVECTIFLFGKIGQEL